MDVSANLLECEKKLGQQVNELTKQRNDRLRKLGELKRAEKHLCAVLSEKACDVRDGKVPSLNQLAQLEEFILRLECEKVCVCVSV